MSLDRPNPYVQSRCPNCDTLYHIDQETLAEAEGQVRCFRCGTVFDALAQQTDDEPMAPAEEEPEIGAELELTRLVESLEPRETDHEREPVPIMLAAAEQNRARPAPAETSAATEQAPASETPLLDTFNASPTGSQTAPETRPVSQPAVEAPDPTASGEPPPGHPSAPGASASGVSNQALPFEVPDDLPDLQPTETPPNAAATPRKRGGTRRRLAGLTGSALVLLLLLAGLAQWLWFQPQYLEPLRPYYARLQAWCAQHDCPLRLPALPTLRAIESFTILQREIAPAEDRPGDLRISMAFVNGAGFAQPYPDILVTLLDSNGETVAERRFQPSDYLDKAEAGLIEPQEVISFDLLTDDPGDSATGFKLKFL